MRTFIIVFLVLLWIVSISQEESPTIHSSFDDPLITKDRVLNITLSD
jgi:hypothetical protein